MKKLSATIICTLPMVALIGILACASDKTPAGPIPQKFIGKWVSDSKKTEMLIGSDSIKIISLHVPGESMEEILSPDKFQVLDSGGKISFASSEMYAREVFSGQKYSLTVAAEIFLEGNQLVLWKKEANGPGPANSSQLVEWTKEARMGVGPDRRSTVTLPGSKIKLNKL